MERRTRRPSRADPRSRGGAIVVVAESSPARGRSPLARGSPVRHEIEGCVVRPIPARAGEPVARRSIVAAREADPRSRGGARARLQAAHDQGGRSPLARGSRTKGRGSPSVFGPIPARAGEPSRSSAAPRWSRANPRSRGGARLAPPALAGGEGQSPLARGSLRGGHDVLPCAGPIPARAGEPSSAWAAW